jgi:ribosomal-protein-alanine N-acetyltransferase
MTEALSAVVDFLFKEVGVNRVEACHDPSNPHSGDVMRKCGMQYEGTQRQAGINNQGLCDMSWYAILAGDRRER